MNTLLGLNTEAFAALLGAIVGSVLTVLLGFLVAGRQERRKTKMQILLVLVGGRGRIFSENVSDHLNAVPIAFSDDTKVRRAYQHFCAIVPVAPPNPELFERYTDLVIEIAKNLGFSRDLDRADIQLGFFPGKPAAPNSVTPAPGSTNLD